MPHAGRNGDRLSQEPGPHLLLLFGQGLPGLVPVHKVLVYFLEVALVQALDDLLLLLRHFLHKSQTGLSEPTGKVDLALSSEAPKEKRREGLKHFGGVA